MPAGATTFAFNSLTSSKFNLGTKNKTGSGRAISTNVFGDNNNNKNKSSLYDNCLLDDDDGEDDENGDDNVYNDDDDVYNNYSGRVANTNSSGQNNNNSNVTCFGSSNLNFSFRNSMLPSPSSFATSQSSSSLNIIPASAAGTRQASQVQRSSSVCNPNCYS